MLGDPQYRQSWLTNPKDPRFGGRKTRNGKDHRGEYYSKYAVRLTIPQDRDQYMADGMSFYPHP